MDVDQDGKFLGGGGEFWEENTSEDAGVRREAGVF